MKLLEVKNISYEVDNKKILNDISIEVNSGDFILITGPSGSGKSTLLKICSSLISPTKGEILFKGKNYLELDLTELRKQIVYCFQTPFLFGESVRENLEFPFLIRDVKPDYTKIKKLFDLFAMSEDYLDRKVEKLSGGEKQRIALMRSMVFMPEILLLDEITSALDLENSKIVTEVIHQVNMSGTTVLWVTHNPNQIEHISNKFLYIEHGFDNEFELNEVTK